MPPPDFSVHRPAKALYIIEEESLAALEAKVKLNQYEFWAEQTPKTVRSPTGTQAVAKKVEVKVVEAATDALERVPKVASEIVEQAPITLRSIAPPLTQTPARVIPVVTRVVTRVAPLRQAARVASVGLYYGAKIATVVQATAITSDTIDKAKKDGAARGVAYAAAHMAEATSLPAFVISALESSVAPEAKPLSGALSVGIETVGIVSDALSTREQAERALFNLASDLEKPNTAFGSTIGAVARFGKEHSEWSCDIVGDVWFVLSGGNPR